MPSQPSERPETPDRGLSFGSVAELYERYRRGYPDEAVDEVLRYAGPRSSSSPRGAGSTCCSPRRRGTGPTRRRGGPGPSNCSCRAA